MNILIYALVGIVVLFFISFAVAIGVDVGMTVFFNKNNAVIKGKKK